MSQEAIAVAYDDVMRLLLRCSRYHSASQILVNVIVPTCPAAIRKLIAKFICGLKKSITEPSKD